MDDYDRLRSTQADRPIVHLSAIDDKTSLLSVRMFGDPRDGGPSFPTMLEESFVELKRSGAEAVVLDLRGNGGGDDTYGALLVS